MVNIILVPFAPTSLAPALLSWQRVAHTIFGSRALLHLRRANETRFATLNEDISMSGPVFRLRRLSAAPQSGPMDGIRRSLLMEQDDAKSWFAPDDPMLYPFILNADNNRESDCQLEDEQTESICLRSLDQTDETCVGCQQTFKLPSNQEISVQDCSLK